MKKRTIRKQFTLLELVIVLSFLSLMMFMVQAVAGQLATSAEKNTACQDNLRKFAQAATQYAADSDSFVAWKDQEGEHTSLNISALACPGAHGSFWRPVGWHAPHALPRGTRCGNSARRDLWGRRETGVSTLIAKNMKTILSALMILATMIVILKKSWN